MKTIKNLSIAVLTAVCLNACSGDYLDTEDHSALEPDAVAEAAGRNPDLFLNGIWAWLVDWGTIATAHDAFNFMSVLLAGDCMSQDIAFTANHYFIYDYQFDDRMENYRRVNVNWSTFYTAISKSNEVINIYPDGGETADEKGLLGQALAVRGMSYTYLVQLFTHYLDASGKIDRAAPGVPIMRTIADGYTMDEIATFKGRNTVGDVLDQAEKDLTKAVELLGEGYERPTDENGKDYIDLGVANGLLARYYLLVQNWEGAAKAAKAAKTGYSQRDAAGLKDGFMDVTASDVMWGFNHTADTETTFASFFSHISAIAPGYSGMGYCTKVMDAWLYNQIPDNDYRKALFNGPEENSAQKSVGAQMPYAPLKFGDKGDWTMDYIYMRAAEMVLIEAEALVRQGKGGEAANVMKELMSKRQPGWNLTNVTLDYILLQRRIELWGEGFAFFDLKRNNLGVDRTYQGNNHLAGYQLVVPAQDVRWTYQIPLAEIQENDLISEEDQNP
jgi:hypothetical protein